MVAAVPEGLLTAMAIILAVGMQRLAKHKGLVRKMLAAETLGSVSVICADKTGTLTTGVMSVVSIITKQDLFRTTEDVLDLETYTEDEESALAIKIGLLCNNSVTEKNEDASKDGAVLGNPTDNALLTVGRAVRSFKTRF